MCSRKYGYPIDCPALVGKTSCRCSGVQSLTWPSAAILLRSRYTGSEEGGSPLVRHALIHKRAVLIDQCAQMRPLPNVCVCIASDKSVHRASFRA